jgi:hypothetical protein
MRYWWVNQNQTYRQEVGGGYLWSPKVKRNGALNPFYEFMREVAPHDLVFSFANQRICALGTALSHAYEVPKPEEFGAAGRNWNRIGWRIDVRFDEIERVVRPVEWIEQLRPLLPKRYSPLDRNGHGSQSMYLTELPEALALALADLVGTEALARARGELAFDVDVTTPRSESLLWEDHLIKEIEAQPGLDSTEKEALVLARRGQGRFREGVQSIEKFCRITRVERAEHLRASHCKPWRDSNDNERLDPENGLLLTPSIDHLFDRGFISFERGGRLLVSPVAHRESLAKMGVVVDKAVDVGGFTKGQERFLEYHHDEVFLKARLRSA